MLTKAQEFKMEADNLTRIAKQIIYGDSSDRSGCKASPVKAVKTWKDVSLSDRQARDPLPRYRTDSPFPPQEPRAGLPV